VSRYYYLILLSVSFLILGCSSKSEYVPVNSIKILDSNLTSKFPQEDTLALLALDASGRADFKQSMNYYTKLYNQTHKVFYAKEAIKDAVIVKDYDSVKLLLEKIASQKHDDPILNGYLIAYYIDKQMFEKAKSLTDSLLKDKRDAKNLELAGLVYQGLGENKRALALYEESYKLDSNEYAIIKMATLLFTKMNQQTKATRLLETHSTLKGCSENICGTLIQFYYQTNDIKGIEGVLKKLYFKTKNPQFAGELIQLYAKEKNYSEAIAFLQKTKLDDSILLDIYTAKKDYKNALKLSKKLYKESENPIYLAKWAVLEYETNNKKDSKKLLKSVTEKFEQVIEILKDPLYYNYYGYLLIDKNIDVDRGIELVKKALAVEPTSHYYIDSLAWGLYKKGECKEALKLLEPISKESDEEEILQHVKDIKKCIEGKK